ncbi:MAG TPA: helix-turn-helix domain-containing protein, partial [Gemmatimonadaceae bacterium]
MTVKHAAPFAAKAVNPTAADADDRGAGQRRRTRLALLQSAAKLVASGKTPTVAEVADAADVSRRTAYRYFPTQEQLLVEASLEGTRAEVESALDAALPHDAVDMDGKPLDDVGLAQARLDAAVKVMHRLTLENEALLRTMIRLTAGGAPDPDSPRPRGYRRVEWLTSAVAPVKSRLGAARFERLVSALTSCIGMDALFLLQDTRGLSPRA